jgi:hypothetical protein
VIVIAPARRSAAAGIAIESNPGRADVDGIDSSAARFSRSGRASAAGGPGFHVMAVDLDAERYRHVLGNFRRRVMARKCLNNILF